MMKKRAVQILCLLMSLMLLVGCAGGSSDMSNNTAPDSSGAAVDLEGNTAAQTEKALAEIKALGTSPDDNYRTWYEIFVYSFCDSDGDGIGDFAGATSKLDYLKELGITGIWLMPIHPSTSYHKYNVSDYYAVDPAYGTMADFEVFLAECEKRDIHVIIDLVLNHTGSEHVWFKEAVAYLQTLGAGEEPDLAVCPYVDYYNFVRSDAPPTGFSIVEGTEDWYYESRFNYDMPDCNMASEALRREFEEVMSFWLDKGVAGFRLDAAKEFYSGSVEKNVEVLHWIQTAATAMKSDCYLVAEVWDSFNAIAEYYQSGITSIFNYPFGNSNGKIVAVLRGAGNESVVTTYATALEKADKAYRGNHGEYIDAPFLSNHDVGRIANFVGRDEAKTKLAGAMNLFMGGSAFLYYGEEIGMVYGEANDPSYRAPMYWNEARNEGTTDLPPGCTLPEEYLFGSLAEQKADDTSVYNYYRQAIAIRNALPVISHGIPTAETELNKGCISACRKSWGEEACIILMNIAPDAAAVDLSAYADWTLAASLSADGNAIALAGNELTLPAYAVAVLRPGV